jgi:hypothetical protein
MATSEVTLPADTYYRLRTYVASGTVITATTFYPMIRLATDTDATFAPYENLCPITGWDGVEVKDEGKNLWNSTFEQGNINSSTGLNYDDTSTTRIRSVGYAELEAGTYILSSSNSLLQASFRIYDAEGTYENSYNNQWNDLPFAFTLSKKQRVRFSLKKSTNASIVPGDATNIQIERGFTVSAYEAFTGNKIYSISFPEDIGTVYDGTLTINKDGTGSLWVDTVSKVIPTITAFSTTGDYGSGAYVDFTETLESGQAKVIAISDVVEGRAFNNRTNFCCAKSTSNSKRMIVYTNADYTVEQYNANIAGGHLVANLATPVSYSLTANQVRTLLGYNAIWADAGQVEVIYRKGSLADLTSMTNVESRTLSTLSMLAPIEFSPATSAHAVNDVFIVGDKLYKATVAIAQGAEIVEGTNVTQTTIMAALQSATGVSF